MNKETIERIIKLLERVRKRPSMYIGGLDSERLSVFLAGLYLALEMVDADLMQIVPEDDVLVERGHMPSCGGIKIALREEGLSEEEVIDEWLAIEIEAWKQVLDGHFDA